MRGAQPLWFSQGDAACCRSHCGEDDNRRLIGFRANEQSGSQPSGPGRDLNGQFLVGVAWAGDHLATGLSVQAKAFSRLH